MPGETDLDKMLSSLEVSRRAGIFVMVTLPSDVEVALSDDVLALISEDEGTTVVVTEAEARRRGWRYEFAAAWLTLEVHSSLEAVGLTAAFSAALGAEGIACNVVAGYFHDHILVPIGRADDAIVCLERLGS